MFSLIISGLVKEAEWPPFGKGPLICLTIFSLCIMSICNFSYFPFWFLGQDFRSDRISSWSLLMIYFYQKEYY